MRENASAALCHQFQWAKNIPILLSSHTYRRVCVCARHKKNVHISTFLFSSFSLSFPGTHLENKEGAFFALSAIERFAFMSNLFFISLSLSLTRFLLYVALRKKHAAILIRMSVHSKMMTTMTNKSRIFFSVFSLSHVDDDDDDEKRPKKRTFFSITNFSIYEEEFLWVPSLLEGFLTSFKI